MAIGYVNNSNKKQQIVVNQIIVKPTNRQILDVGKWSDAMKMADRGRRKDLFDLYENILTDGVLGDAIDKRIRAVTGADLTFQMADGTEVEEMIDFIDTDEFEYLLEEIVKAVFWEYSLIQPMFDKTGMSVYSVPRKHIRPETKTVAINETDPEGQISYDGLDVIEVHSRKQKHGLLLRACPYAILKRGGIGDWAQMVEIFGMPLRVGKYSVHDTAARKALEDAFNSQGGAPTLIVPKETDIETKVNANTGGGTLYKDFIATLDDQLLITILSQTMTTKDGSSRSQSETHKEVEETVNKQDLRFVQRILNHKFLPILEKRGFPVKGGSFIFPKTLENLKVDEIVSLASVLAIPAYYVQERWGIPAAEESDIILQRQSVEASHRGDSNEPGNDTSPTPPKEKAGREDKKPKTKKRLFDFFAFAPTKERGNQNKRNFATRLIDSITRRVTLADKYTIDLDKLLQEALNEVYGNEVEGKEQPAVSEPLFTISNDALQHGINQVFSDPEFGKKNEEFINEFRHNTAVFAAFKNHRQTEEIVALLHDEKGNLRSFREFKKLALQVSKDYNVNWLQAEYNTAVRSARNAVNYRNWLETEHLYPNLEYMESTAAHPRASHLSYVGTVLPIRHWWWNKHMPPSDWNCACPVRPTDKEVTPVPGEEHVPPVFQNNPGKTAEFVNLKEHPYIKGVCPFFNSCLRRQGKGSFAPLKSLSDGTLPSGEPEGAPPIIPQCEICKVAADAMERAKRERRKRKDKEIREWAQENIPEYGKIVERNNFISGSVVVNRKSVNNISAHFTELHLKELAKDIDAILEKAQYITETPLNPESHNYAKKAARGVTGYRYYKLFHKGHNIRLNVEIRDGVEYVYSLNLIVK